MERTDRIAALVEDMSVEELRRTTLQAIDHAFKSAAEVAESVAEKHDALVQIDRLRNENRHLRQLLGLDAAEGSAPRRTSASPVRRLVGRLRRAANRMLRR